MKNYYKIFILVLSINSLFLLSSCAKEKPAIPSPFEEIIQKHGIVTLNNSDDIVNIIAYGDTRGGWFEDNRDQKNHETVVKNILNHKSIDFILFSGDSVLNGWEMERWKNFYRSVNHFRGNKIQFFPVLGNHELRTRGLIPRPFEDFQEESKGNLRRLIDNKKEQEEIRDIINIIKKLPEKEALGGAPDDEKAEVIDELILEKSLEKSPQDILKIGGKPSNWEVFEKSYLNAPDNLFQHLKQIVKTGKTYYAFIYSTKNSPPILVMALDTNLYTDERQYKWFEEIVTHFSDGPIVAVAHHSPYTSGIHCLWSGEDESGVGFRKKYKSLLDNVAIWIAGHDHNYERISATAHPNNQLIKKPVYIVTGAGGSKPRFGIPAYLCREYPKPDRSSDSRFKKKYNFIQITFRESILEVTSWGADIGSLTESSASPFKEIEHFVVDWKER
jgi:hypothetical protein